MCFVDKCYNLRTMHSVFGWKNFIFDMTYDLSHLSMANKMLAPNDEIIDF